MGFEIKMVCDTCGAIKGGAVDCWAELAVWVELALGKLQGAKEVGVEPTSEIIILCKKCAAARPAA